MKFYSLGSNCSILTWKQVTFLIDCGLEPFQDVHTAISSEKSTDSISPTAISPIRLPSESLFDLYQVDIILIHNQKLDHKMSPFLKKIQIYCTLPTKDLGKPLFNEIFSNWKQHSHHHLHKNQKEQMMEWWIKELWNTITPISFDEPIKLYHNELVCTAKSSGFALGSCNWVLESKIQKEKIVILGASSTAWKRHPTPLHLHEMNQCDVLLCLEDAFQKNPFPWTQTAYQTDTQLLEMCKHIRQAISNGGDVLIPVHSTGLVLDLIDSIKTYLQSINLGQSIPMFFISSMADYSLQYANISSEWMNSSKQVKVSQAENPFVHLQLLKNKQLLLFDSVSQEFATAYFMQNRTNNPCIIFASHPSLQIGPICKLISLLDKNSKNMLLCVEHEFPYSMTQQVKKMQVVQLAIELRLSQREWVEVVVQEIQPKQIVIPQQWHSTALEQVVQGFPYASHNKVEIRTFEPLSILEWTELGQPLSMQQIEMNANLAQKIYPQPRIPFHHQIEAIAPIPKPYTISSKNGNNFISVEEAQGATQQMSLYGRIQLPYLLQYLQTHGIDISQLEITKQVNGFTLNHKETETRIIIHSSLETEIETYGTTKPQESLQMRQLFKQMVLNCLVV